MGKFVDSNLLPQERVIAETKLHWSIFIGPLFLAVIFIFLAIFCLSGGVVPTALVFLPWRLLYYFLPGLPGSAANLPLPIKGS